MSFFFIDTATTEIYTLSLHDALPIFSAGLPASYSPEPPLYPPPSAGPERAGARPMLPRCPRSEEHTSELQSLRHLVCRLLLEKKKHEPRPEPDRAPSHDGDVYRALTA